MAFVLHFAAPPSAIRCTDFAARVRELLPPADTEPRRQWRPPMALGQAYPAEAPTLAEAREALLARVVPHVAPAAAFRPWAHGEDAALGAVYDDHDDHDAPARLADEALWASASLLGWHLKCDGVIGTLSAPARQRKTKIANAIRMIVAALREVYPALADETDADLAQLAALGRDMALAAAQSPDLMAYAKSELQEWDLAAALGL